MKRRGGVAWTARYEGRNKAGFSCQFFYSHGNVLIRIALLKRIKVGRCGYMTISFAVFIVFSYGLVNGALSYKRYKVFV